MNESLRPSILSGLTNWADQLYQSVPPSDAFYPKTEEKRAKLDVNQIYQLIWKLIQPSNAFYPKVEKQKAKLDVSPIYQLIWKLVQPTNAFYPKAK